MLAWIISDDRELTLRIQMALNQLLIECPPDRILSLASVELFKQELSQPTSVIFLATDNVAKNDFEDLKLLSVIDKTRTAIVTQVRSHTDVLGAIRAGVSDVLDIAGDLDQEISDFVGRLRSEHRRESHSGKLVTVIPCRDPFESTVLASNIAVAIAELDVSCVLLDFHFRGGDVATALGLAPQHTILDLINMRQDIDEAMFRQALVEHGSNVQVLAGPELFSDIRGIHAEPCNRVLELAHQLFPFIVVSTEDAVHSEQVRVLAASDEIVIAMRLDLVGLRRARLHLDFLTRSQISPRRIHVVAMGAGVPGELPAKAVEKHLGAKVHCVPCDVGAATVCTNLGSAIVQEFPHSKAALALRKLAAILSDSEGKDEARKPTASWSTFVKGLQSPKRKSQLQEFH